MNVLFIDACVRPPEQSRTYALCQAFLSAYRARSGCTVTSVRLVDAPPQPLTHMQLAQRDAAIARGDFSAPCFLPARQLADADLVVIGAPYWDLSFPAVLKAYIEQIMVGGVTFRYTDHGPQGLCRAGQLLYLSTAGGPVDEHLGYRYIAAVASMLGIGQSHLLCAQNLDVQGCDAAAILAQATADATALAAQI